MSSIVYTEARLQPEKPIKTRIEITIVEVEEGWYAYIEDEDLFSASAPTIGEAYSQLLRDIAEFVECGSLPESS